MCSLGSLYIHWTSCIQWCFHGVFIVTHKRACCHQKHHLAVTTQPCGFNHLWLWNLSTTDNACSVLRAVFVLMHLCGQSSCSSVFSSSNVITRAGGEEGRVNENGMGPIEASPSLPPSPWGLAEQHSPWPSHISPSSPAAVLSYSELAARAAGVGVDVFVQGCDVFFSLPSSPSFSLCVVSLHILLPYSPRSYWPRFLIPSSSALPAFLCKRVTWCLYIDHTNQTWKSAS